jgi:hypothetical protein
VFDAPKFGGMHNFINGPSKHRSLANLPGGGNWDARIRSLKVGPGALVRAWAAEDFAGVSLRATPEQQQADLSDGFDRKIQSLQVECRTAAAAPGIR